MKDIFLMLFTSVLFIFSCKGQDKDKKNNSPEVKVYIANCIGEYSTREKTSPNDKKWSLTKSQLNTIIDLSFEISESEWHAAYAISPCNIEIDSILYKDQFYNAKINGGSYLSLVQGNRLVILGCDSPKCKEYFLREKENMFEDGEKSDKSSIQLNTIKYKVDFNKNGSSGLIIVKRQKIESELTAQIDSDVFFQKTFICDHLNIDTTSQYGQAFNLKLEYDNQYQKVFRKIVIPVFYKSGDFVIEKVFISTLSQSAKTEEEEWFKKEIRKKSSLRNLDLEQLIIN